MEVHLRRCDWKPCERKYESKPGTGGNCGGCGQVYYCSKEHQRNDFEFHKHICSKDPAQRVRKFLALLSTPDSLFTIIGQWGEERVWSDRCCCNISCPGAVRSGNHNSFSFDLFGLSSGDTSCATCYQPLQYTSMAVFIKYNKKLRYKGKLISYAQCRICFDRCVLCPSSFTARDKCPQKKKLYYELFFYSQQINTVEWVKDINHCIGSLLYLIFDDNCSCKEIL